MKKLQVKGIDIIVYKTKVKIFDPKGELSDDHAILLLEYLHFEGFLSEDAQIQCEIISDDN
jgi:hypothetical protein|tara:strand:+ start:743 stop:925 length:183 start_codon:yes stop_codon:yes gene_type:complete